MADEMRKDVMENIQDYLATQLMVHTNSRTKILRSRDSELCVTICSVTMVIILGRRVEQVSVQSIYMHHHGNIITKGRRDDFIT